MRTLERRELLKSVVLGSTVLASGPAGAHLAAAMLDDHIDFSFHVLALGNGPTAGNVAHRIFLVGTGLIDRLNVVGGGSFQHYDGNTPRPRRILTAGQWTARRLLPSRLVGRWGSFTAGLLLMEVEFSTTDGRVIPATLKLVHNIIGPAGIDTGEPEGFTITFTDRALGQFQTSPAQAPVPVTEFVDRAALRRGLGR